MLELFFVRRSHLPRWFAILCLAIIVLVSFYPLEDWSAPTEPLFDFLSYPLPYYILPFDILVNVLAYIPYGFALALLPRKHRHGFWLAIGISVLTSGLVETVQMFLPARISSNLDILCNVGGALIGALIATHPWSRQFGRQILRVRHHIFRSGWQTDYLLLLLALWFLTQLDPSVPLFGVVVQGDIPQPFVSPIKNAALFLFLIEVGSIVCNVVGTLLIVTLCTRRRAQRLPWALSFFICAFTLKLLVAALFLKPTAMLDWLSARVMLGLLAGLCAVIMLARMRYLWRAWCAGTALSGLLILAAHWPLTADAHFDFSKVRHHYGHLSNLSALADMASQVWPWLVLMVLASSIIALIRLPVLDRLWLRWQHYQQHRHLTAHTHRNNSRK